MTDNDTSFDALPWLDGVVLRTVSGYFNGPLDGLAVFDGRIYWYAVRDFTFEEENTPDEFVLYELSDAEIADELRRQQEFREHVGTHWDLDEHGRRASGGTIRPESDWQTFYSRHPPGTRPPYEDHVAVGRFRARI